MFVLHIGAPKTGSEQIASFLMENREAMRDKGWVFRRPMAGKYALPEFYQGLSGEDAQEFVMEYVEDALFLLSRHDNVISSNEFFFEPWVPEVLLPQLVQALGGDIKIVVYMMRPDIYLETMYKHRVMNNTALANTRMFTNQFNAHLNGNIVLKEFNRFVETQNIAVRPHEVSQLVGGNVVSDFLSVLNIDLPVSDAYPPLLPELRLSRAMIESLGPLARKAKVSPQVLYSQVLDRASAQTMRENDVYELEERRDILKTASESLEEIRSTFRPDLEKLFDDHDITADDAPDRFPSNEERKELEAAADLETAWLIENVLQDTDASQLGAELDVEIPKVSRKEAEFLGNNLTNKQKSMLRRASRRAKAAMKQS